MIQVQPQQQEKPPLWQRKWFVESIWISGFTRWLLTFGGKAARIVLIICTLYMSAQLYPGVSLPPGLSLAVFIILSFALDMGGLGLAQIAKTAREHGNDEGAEQGEHLSKWLIRIMIAGLVTVSLEHAVDLIKFTPEWKNYIAVFWIIVEIALSVARVICAVNYGHVVHALEQSVERDDEQAELREREREQTIEQLRTQVKQANATKEQSEREYELTIERLRTQVKQMETTHASLLKGTEGQGSIIHNLQDQLSRTQEQVRNLTASLRQSERDHEQTIGQLRNQVAQLEATRESLLGGAEGQDSIIRDLQDQVTQIDHEKQILATQVNRSEMQVTDLMAKLERAEKQVTDLTSQYKGKTSSPSGQSESKTQGSQVRSRKSEQGAQEMTGSQGTVLQFVPKADGGRRRHDPLEVKAWCEAHTDLSQIEQATQLGISDAANLRRLLRRARELEEGGQAANDQ